MPRTRKTPPAKPATRRRVAPSGLKAAGFYRITDLAKPDGLTGLGRSTLYDMANAGTFPAPVKLSLQVSAWPVPAVNAWLAERGGLPTTTAQG